MSDRAELGFYIKDVWHDSKRVHVVGKIGFTPGDYATEVCVADLIAISNQYRAVSSITDDLNLEGSSATGNNALDLNPVRIDPTKIRTLTGSIDAPGGSNTVTGVGTKFLTQLKVGDYILLGTATDGEIRQVTAIATDLSCTTSTQFSNLANDVSPQAVGPDGLIPINGNIDPVADPTITVAKGHFLGYGLFFNLSRDKVGNSLAGVKGQPIWMQARGRNGFIYNVKPFLINKYLTGSIDLTASNEVTGVGTLFTKELVVGDRWVVGPTGAGEERMIVSITDDTHLNVDAPHTDLGDDTHPVKLVNNNLPGESLFQVFGQYVTGGAAAAGTAALYADAGGKLVKEAATDVVFRPYHLPTAALPAAVLNDDIDFYAIYRNV